MFNVLVSAIIAITISVGSFFGINQFILKPIPENEIREIINFYVEESIKNSQTLGADSTLPIAGTTYNLSGAGVSSSATSITLATLTLPQTGQKLVDSDFSTTFYLTLEPGNRTRQEIVSCTTVVQNTTTATLSGCTRGLSPITPYTASTTLRFAHGGGTQVIFSDPPQLFNQFAGKDNDETVTGIWDFSTSPTVPTPTAATQAANKTYVDSGVLAGAATSTESITGISRLATKLQGASSTPTTANTPLVIQAQSATSTYNGGTAGGNGLNVVVTQNNNTIDPNFIATSSNYTWTGNQTFTKSTTTNATTTSLQVSALASTSQMIVGALGIGVATTTQRNVEIAGDLQISGALSVSGAGLDKMVFLTTPVNSVNRATFTAGTYTDVDLTSTTTPNVARFAIINARLDCTLSSVDGSKGCSVKFRLNGSSATANLSRLDNILQVASVKSVLSGFFIVPLDSGEIFEYDVSSLTGDVPTIALLIDTVGYIK